MSSAGLPTSQAETTSAVQGILTPEASPDPAQYSPLQKIPILGPIFRAQRETYAKDKAIGLIPLAGPPILRTSEQVKQGDYAGASGSALNALTQLFGLKAGLTRAPAVASESLSDVAGRTAGYELPGAQTNLGAKISAFSSVGGQYLRAKIPFVGELYRRPSIFDIVDAFRAKA